VTERSTTLASRHRARTCALAATLLVALLLALPLAGSVLVPAAHAEIATQYQLESDLTCQCGCGLTVHSCNHLNCGSGIPLKKEIAEHISAGESREDILLHFQTKYGEKILSSPTTTGFNIAAWTVPFVAIALGGLLIGVVLVRWRRATTSEPTPPSGTTPTTDPELRARLERELADLEKRS
jgi:cytochrome c-type biogenesis protein CcmH/NrfF